MKIHCCYCRYFEFKSMGHGECRRKPPAVICGEGFGVVTKFPKVLPDQWCGEYEEEEEEEE